MPTWAATAEAVVDAIEWAMEPRYRFSPEELTGRSRNLIVDLAEPHCGLHQAVVEPFLALRAAAAAEGIDLLPVSSFRDFSRQLAIWNGKCRGERELRDREGRLLDATTLDEEALVDAILQWSALPGTSRHHWGTDFDVIDRSAVPPGYHVQFVPEEYAEAGVFSRLNGWLTAHAEDFGFYRPYGSYRGGVQPEPWHFSHAVTAESALAQFSVEILQQALQSGDLLAWPTVATRLPAIVERYVRNVDPPPVGAVNRATRPA
jgi:LAS superfamily LD-carboxypeptidase LdcB